MNALPCLLALAMQQSLDPERPAQPPTLHPTRYVEDYDSLRDQRLRDATFLGDWKRIPLDDSGDAFLSTGFELRVRYERLDGADFERDSPADGVLLTRALPLVDLRTSRAFRVFVQGIGADDFDRRGPSSPVDVDRFDVAQAFGEYDTARGDVAGMTLRAGRQLLGLGSERLVSTRYGANVPRPFDGIRVQWRDAGLTIDAAFGRPVRTRVGAFDDTSDDERTLGALHACANVGDASFVDAYVLWTRDSTATYAQGTAHERRATTGLRWTSRNGPLRFDVEGFRQTGRFGDASIRAWSVTQDIGWRCEGVPLEPEIGCRVSVISGDRDASDATLQTFQPLYPRAKYFGELSPLAPQNLVHLHPTVTTRIGEGIHASLSVVAYWRHRTGDGIYGPSGALLREPIRSGERFVGWMPELVVTFQPTRELEFLVSASWFRAGAFLREGGDDTDQTLLAVEGKFWF